MQDAAESSLPRESRIASTILNDDKKHRHWELQHASLLLPVAEHRAKKRQILELRRAEIRLIHHRALFSFLQTHDLPDDRRQELFRLFHSTLDYQAAILTEHRHYMNAVSSHISNDHIIDMMQDETSMSLLELYEKTFARYFEMKCYIATAKDSHCVDFVRLTARGLYEQLLRVRRRIETEQPVVTSNDFYQQELLSRSGRYEIQNYLNV
ncbi:MAG: hypothetical protein ACR2RD_10880 [Woeseiaceae bacterium]